jgi:PTS system nitrogen regulatory IIA component
VRLSHQLDPSLVLIAPSVAARDELFEVFAALVCTAGLIESPDLMIERLAEREAILSTGIGGGVAVPHAQIPGLSRLIMVVSTHPAGLEYPALDDLPVRLVFCLLGGAHTAADHLAGLARLARLARRPERLEPLIHAADGAELRDCLEQLEGA